MRIFPEMWASTLCPFSSWTRNIALGSGSTTVPSSTIASSLGFGIVEPPRLLAEGRAAGTKPFQGTLYGISASNSKHFGAVIGHGDGVLEMGAEAPVGRLHRPPVVHQHRPRPAHVHHGLHGEHVPHPELDPPPRGAVVRDLGLLVHGRADAVAHVLLHDRVAGPLGDGLHRVADVGEAVAVADLGDGGLEALLGDLHEPAGVLADLADRDGDGGVAVVALDDRPAVEGDDVALLEDVGAGDAVHDHVV